MKLTSELVNRQKLVQMCLHGLQVWPTANVYSSGLPGLRQTKGVQTVMRQVLPDSSLPLLGRLDATLTSQCLILCLFLRVLPCLTHLAQLPLSPHSFAWHIKCTNQKQVADWRKKSRCFASTSHHTPPCSVKISTLTLAGASGYRYQSRLSDKRLNGIKEISICLSTVRLKKALT